MTHPFGIVETRGEGQRAKDWVKKFRHQIAPYTTGGVWLNFVGDEGEGRIRAAFGDENYARLARVKAEFDPSNVFHGNQNIRPAALQST